MTDCLLHGRVTHILSFQRFQLSVFSLWTKMSRSSSRHGYPTISDAIFPFGFRLTQRGLRGGHVPALLSPFSLIVERIAPRGPIWTWNGSVGAKSTRPWLDAPLWRRRSLPMNEGGHLICVIASKSTLDSSLDGWDYNADAELFLPRQVIRWESCWRKIKSEISWWEIASWELKGEREKNHTAARRG